LGIRGPGLKKVVGTFSSCSRGRYGKLIKHNGKYGKLIKHNGKYGKLIKHNGKYGKLIKHNGKYARQKETHTVGAGYTV
jgi:predicted ferric reductase